MFLYFLKQCFPDPRVLQFQSILDSNTSAQFQLNLNKYSIDSVSKTTEIVLAFQAPILAIVYINSTNIYVKWSEPSSSSSYYDTIVLNCSIVTSLNVKEIRNYKTSLLILIIITNVFSHTILHAL